MNEELKTEYRKMREQKDREIVAMFEQMMSKKGAMMVPVMEKVAHHFGLYSITSIWAARKRVAKRRAEGLE